jgi:two-component system cell cycle sensor histidine kinase/response regulator CckA
VTEKQHESSLAAALVESSVDGLFTLDREYRYTLWNPAMERFAGKRALEVLGNNSFDVFPFLRDLGLDVLMARVLRGETVFGEAIPSTVPSGATHYFDRHYSPLRGDSGSVVGVVGIVRDVTERHNAQEALRASEEKLRMAVEASDIGIWSWDTVTDDVVWEPALSAIFGLPPGTAPRGREAYLALIHPDDRENATSIITRGIAAGRWEGEHRILRNDGEVRWVLTKGSKRGGQATAIGAVIDVTDRKKRDEQLRQAQKLEAVGELTAGIAHNFNNILMAIVPNLELAAGSASAELAPLLSSAQEAAMRAADLVRKLMTFAGRNHPTARVAESIGMLVERTVAFCRTTFDRRIALHGTYDHTACAIVDPSQMEQVVLNILINARDALTDPRVATPRVDVTVDIVGEEARGDHEARQVRVRVRDNGLGMDAATVARVFEPFFTTKDVGMGTGLGLATTQAILREHGGLVLCESVPNGGATFSFRLPLAEAEHKAPVAARSADPRGSETILIVDDEAAIRQIVGRMLLSAGYTAKLAASGHEAIELLSDPRVAEQIALVLLDVSMPGMSGRALREYLRELTPRARVVYFTGYAYDAADPDDAVIQKPITARLLLETVREILDRPR